MPPPSTGVHHFSLTVRDMEASSDWYQRVFGMQRFEPLFPHWGDEASGRAVVLMQPETGFIVGIHHHAAAAGETFHEARTGLDHLALGVANHDDLHAWTAWLDELGIAHSGVNDVTEPMPYSTVVFRDPDNIQLEIAYMAGG